MLGGRQITVERKKIKKYLWDILFQRSSAVECEVDGVVYRQNVNIGFGFSLLRLLHFFCMILFSIRAEYLYGSECETYEM